MRSGHKLLGPEQGPLTGEREGEPVAPQLMTHAACIVASVHSFAPSFNLEAWFLDEAPREASLRGEEVALARVTLRARPCLRFASAALLVNFLCGGLAGAVRVCVCVCVCAVPRLRLAASVLGPGAAAVCPVLTARLYDGDSQVWFSFRGPGRQLSSTRPRQRLEETSAAQRWPHGHLPSRACIREPRSGRWFVWEPQQRYFCENI